MSKFNLTVASAVTVEPAAESAHGLGGCRIAT